MTSLRTPRQSHQMHFISGFTLLIVFSINAIGQEKKPAKPAWQYDAGGIQVPAASADEPKIEFGVASVKAAVKYLDDGALSWTRGRKCIACHSTGVYLAERTQLTRQFGPPQKEVYDVFATTVPDSVPEPQMRDGKKMYADVIFAVWRTLGLAQWDKHVNGKLSPETEKSIKDLLMRQSDDGLWTTATKVEIPYIRTDYELGLQSLRAIVAAPGWLEKNNDAELKKRVDKLQSALKNAKPANDFERVQRLQLFAIMPSLVSKDEIAAANAILTQMQKSDGGWSTRSFSKTADWGPNITPENIKMIDSEADAADPASDPFMTAFAVVSLRESGTPTDDPRIVRAIAWLKANQRQTGRWWMKSLYKNTQHYITYISTAQVLRALALCNELPVNP